MGLLDMFNTPNPQAIDETLDRVEGVLTWAEVAEQLDIAHNNLELMEQRLEESLADVELGLEDRSWRLLGMQHDQFTRGGLLTAARLCRVMAVVNPLIKRGLNLRSVYVWGGGVQIQARAAGPTDDNEALQDVNEVVQVFLDDPATRKVLTGASAKETNERTLGTDGMIALACFTKPVTGRVQLRPVPTDEIEDIITNPDDATEVWYYKRCWARTTVQVNGSPVTDQVTTYYPDIDYRPRGARPVRINGVPVMWDAPIAFLAVNGLADWQFGVGDAFAAIPWARAYKEFLEDWAKLVKSLSRFAWRQTSGTKGRASKVAEKIRATAPSQTTPNPNDTGVGAVAVGGPGIGSLEAIPKSGATIDSGSGKPLAGMVASGLEVPLTMLLADPGVTGARATAETLDPPTELMAGQRRDVWADFLRRLLDYVIDQQVKAPQGALNGTVTRDEWGREVITLAGDTPRTVDFAWPDLSEATIKELMEAISAADEVIGNAGPAKLTLIRLALQALGVRDVDEIVEKLTDEDGDWIDPGIEAGQAAVDAFRRGEDPAAVVRGGDVDPDGD